jgi:hypothetical protein
MKGSLLASGLVFGTLASSVVANPLEGRALGIRTITQTATTTQTNTVTKYNTLTRTVTEIEKEIIKKTKTKTKTVVSSTIVTVDRPITVTKTSTRNVPGPTTTKTVVNSTTLVVNRPTTVYKTSTAVVTKSLPPTTILSTKTLPVSVSTKVLPASTIVSTKIVQIAGPTVTRTSTIKASTVFAPAQIVTSFLTEEIPGPTITAISTAYVNNGNGTCGSPSSIDGRNITTSATPFPTLTATTSFDNLNMTMTATSPSAATSSAVVAYANVKTATCDSAPAYYIQIDNSGTKVDGTVLCNQGGPSSSGSWMYMYPPASAESLDSLGVGPMIPQPFTFDQETGDLVSYWNSGESLRAYVTSDGRAGNVFSGSYDPPLSCGLEDSTLVNCGSKFTGAFQMGVRVEGSGSWLHMLRVAGGNSYDSDYDHDATFTLIPACDLNDSGSISPFTSSSSTVVTASSTSSSAAATSTAPSYANVITAQCDNPKGYYIEINNSGTAFDGTVMLNGNKGQRRQWMFYQAPSDLVTLGQRAPQPFNFDSSTGMLTTTWSTGEALSVYVIQNVDTRSGFISAEDPGSWMLICSLNGDQLVNCHASETPSQQGLRIESNGMLRAAGGYNYENAQDATFRLIPACDI